MADTNNIIPNGLRADVMRNKMENKDALQNAGDIYVGTGEMIEITADGNTYEIPKTIGMNLSDAIKEYGGIKSFPLSDALKPQPLDADLAKSTANTISFYTENSNVNLGNDCAVPSNSEGIIVSNGKGNITLYYSDAVEAGAFFYNGTTWSRLIQKIRTSSIEPSSSSINLGSNGNGFNTIYANRYYLPGTVFNFQYNSNDESRINVLMGFNCISPDGNKVPINTFCFLDGQGEGSKVNDYAWIKARGIEPYNNNEINFDLQGDDVGNIYFCRNYSTKQIKNYKFMDGQDPNGTYNNYASIESAAKNFDYQEFNASSSYIFSNGITPKSNPGDIQNLTIPAWGQGVYINRPGSKDGAIWITDNLSEQAGTRFYFINNGNAFLSPIEAPFFNATSDKRLKENIIPFTSEKSILDLPIYTFNFKSDEKKKKHVGCLAQDLQEICPDLVNEDSQGYLSIEESKITYLLLEEVKELKKQVEELKEKVNELEGK